MSTPSMDPRLTPRDIASELFWSAVFSVLALSAALVIVAGVVVLEGGAMQIVLGVLLILAIGHAWNQHRRAYELRKDPRFRQTRERRGF